MTFENFILALLSAGMNFNYINLIDDIDALVVYYPDKMASMISFPQDCIYDDCWDDRLDQIYRKMQIVI